MDNLALLEACYRKFSQDVNFWLPEDIIEVDVSLLHQMNLLGDGHSIQQETSNLTRYFHVIESDDKITLVNENFVIWIVPETNDGTPLTSTLIAVNDAIEPQLKLCFVTSGVYNHSHLVLRVLEKFLNEIQENEDTIRKLAHEKPSS